METNVAKEIRKLYLSTQKRIHCLAPKPKKFNNTKFQIIQYLLKRENEVVYQKDIVEDVHLKKSSVAECLDTMEESDEIVRFVDKNDKRKKIVKLTEKSLKVKEQIN